MEKRCKIRLGVAATVEVPESCFRKVLEYNSGSRLLDRAVLHELRRGVSWHGEPELVSVATSVLNLDRVEYLVLTNGGDA